MLKKKLFSEMNYRWGSEIKKKGSDGMANAAIETFKSGNIMTGFIRELLQNSQDARLENDKPLKVTVRFFSIYKSEIPVFEENWVPIYEAVKKKWLDGYSGFFERADDVLSGEKISVLEYSDFNTSGLSGSDNDDKRSFSACVLSEGNSVEKKNDAGGSYGIGKNAVFGMSGIRTVLYSSLNEEGETIFQGVSKLASYVQDANSFSSRIYLGQNNEDLSSVRNEIEIPSIFRREELGLSQFILGSELNSSWIDELVSIIIKNYFILLHQNKLVFRFVDESSAQKKELTLDHSNFKEYAYQSFTNIEETDITSKSEHVWPKIMALKEQPFKKDILDKMGNILPDAFVVHFLNDEHTGLNIVNYTRKGMLIYSEKLHSAGGIGYLNLIGVFYSENKDVNAVLRLMEPATHDAWKKDLLTDRIKNSDDLSWAASLEKQIKEFVREIAKKFLGDFSHATHTINEVDELLKIGSNPSSIFRSKLQRSGQSDEEKETALKTGKKYEVDLNFSSLGENTVEGEFLDKPSARLEGGNQSDNSSKRTKNKKGGTTSPKKKNIPAITYKCILKEDGEFERSYNVVMNSTEPMVVDIELFQAGDRGSKLLPEILSVTQMSNNLIVNHSDESVIISRVNLNEGSTNLIIRIKSLSKAGIILQPIKIY
jgi:hypothetical protein